MNNEEVVNVTKNLEEGSQIVTDAANRVVEGVISLELSKGQRVVIAAGYIALIAVGCAAIESAVYPLAKHIAELKEAKRKTKKSQKKQSD